MGIIYKVTNKINGMIYVGQRKITSEKFLTSWYYGSGKYILLALKKYGKENFSKNVLDECQDQCQLDQKEKYWIGFYNSLCPNGYNIANSAWGGNNGGQNRGKHWSVETKQKISDTIKAQYTSGERQPTFLGLKHSEKTKQKIREKRKFQIMSKEARARATITQREHSKARGYFHSEESKRKIGEKNSIALKRFYANGGKPGNAVPREMRTCICGCGNSFKCKVRSKRKYYKADHWHAVKRKEKLDVYTGQSVGSKAS